MNVGPQFALVGKLLQNSINNVHELQESGDQHNLLPIVPDATSFQQDKLGNLLIPSQEIKHHFDQDLELLAGRRNACCGQPDRRVDLLPAVLENRLQNALFVGEMFDELRFASARKPANGGR